MKRSKWKKKRTEAGLRTLVPSLPERAPVDSYFVWPFRGRSLGFAWDRLRAHGHPLPTVRSTRSESNADG